MDSGASAKSDASVELGALADDDCGASDGSGALEDSGASGLLSDSSSDGLGDKLSSLEGEDGDGEVVGEKSSDEDGASDEGLGDGDGAEPLFEPFEGDALGEDSGVWEAVTRPITTMETRARTNHWRAIM